MPCRDGCIRLVVEGHSEATNSLRPGEKKMIVTQAVVVAAAAVLVSTITAVRVYHWNKSFHVALIEAVFAVSATMTAAGFLSYEYSHLFVPNSNSIETPASNRLPSTN